jgi:hypothetical protein
MLPKPEKLKKVKTEQLDLVEKISDEDKIRKKRKYLIIAIICTVGLSAIFYCYHHLESLNLSFSLPSIKNLNFNKIPNFTHDKDISLYVQSNDFTYEYLSTSISDIAEILSTLSTAPIKKLDNLPSGVEIREFDNADISAYYLSVPTKTIQIIIKSNNSQKKSQLVEKIYWYLVNRH